MHTDIRNWFTRTRSKLEEDGITGLAWAIYHLYVGFWISLTSRFPLGTNIFSRDWDVLIILDACRVDALREVEDEYEFIHSVDSIYSVGSTSSEWIAKTFTESYRNEAKNTSYITGNPYAELILQKQQLTPVTETNSISFPVPICSPAWNTLSGEDLSSLDIIRTHSEERGFVEPRPITEQAISVGRNRCDNKIIVHYMQPHRPYIGENLAQELQGTDISRKMINGELSKSDVWDAYLDTLRYVLDEVKLLLENIDADRVVITADHGEGFGEHSTYSHNYGWIHPVVKEVPWVETTATDGGNHKTIDETDQDIEKTVSVEERLANLGYLDN